MLELVRLRLNKCDDPVMYANPIRTHLAMDHGKLGRQGAARGPRGTASLRL